MVQPYQVLFPIGILYGVWGALVWILYVFNLWPYPGQLHAHLMISGFLFAFATGFLMTAVPKFTGASAARPWELVLASGLVLAGFFGYAEKGASLLILIFLAFFFASRFRQRAYSPPPHFIFIPMGLGLGILGAALMLKGVSEARTLFFQGPILCFVLGVGGKLVSALLGWGQPPLVQIETKGKVQRRLPTEVWVPAVLLLSGFLLEFADVPWIARSLRAVAATWIGIGAWRFHRRPRASGRLANWLWVSTWGLVGGLWFYALVPSLGIHALHFVFMSGFGLMTLMVACRVSLAHGGYGLELEMSSQSLRWAGVLILLAGVTRVTAPLTSSYFNHLGYAAGVWILAIVVWSAVFLPKILARAPSAERKAH